MLGHSFHVAEVRVNRSAAAATVVSGVSAAQVRSAMEIAAPARMSKLGTIAPTKRRYSVLIMADSFQGTCGQSKPLLIPLVSGVRPAGVVIYYLVVSYSPAIGSKCVGAARRPCATLIRS